MKRVCLSIDIGLKNFAYALVEFHESTWTLREWKCLDLTGGKKVKSWEKCLNAFLRSFSLSVQPTDIIVEQQHARRNALMAAYLKGYFTAAFPDAHVRSVVPASKGEKCGDYKHRKLYSVSLVQTLESRIDPNLFSEWKLRKKQDDMADALVQSLKAFKRHVDSTCL